jgi:glycerophosphoryl diester phosphodiesterase
MRPIVIGHRGACGYRPEHTLASYRLAIELGADFIEPDLVATRDGRLVARHENEISGTTDIAAHPELAARKTEKTIDGRVVLGFFTEDFTLAELKTLRARERIPERRPGNTAFDGCEPIPTLEEVIALAQSESRARGRTIGVYPETKQPSYFRELGLPLEEPLVRALHDAGYCGLGAPVFIQSFEVGNLDRLRGLTELPLIQLIDATGAPYDHVRVGSPLLCADMITKPGLAVVARYAAGIGVNKNLIVPRDLNERWLEPSELIADAHAHGLLVHAWTFRAENHFLPAELRSGEPNQHGDLSAEIARFFQLGVDGVFADHPDIAVTTRAALGHH